MAVKNNIFAINMIIKEMLAACMKLKYARVKYTQTQGIRLNVYTFSTYEGHLFFRGMSFDFSGIW